MADVLVEVADTSLGFAEVSDEVADVSIDVADLSDEVADVPIEVAKVSNDVARASVAVADISVEVPSASVEVLTSRLRSRTPRPGSQTTTRHGQPPAQGGHDDAVIYAAPMTRRDASYQEQAPEPVAVEAMAGLVLLDFGTDWCGHCVSARAPVEAWLDGRDGVEHLRVEDGRGRVLGRAYRVKLWPTLVLLRDGHEIARVVRPRELRDLQSLDAALV